MSMHLKKTAEKIFALTRLLPMGNKAQSVSVLGIGEPRLRRFSALADLQVDELIRFFLKKAYPARDNDGTNLIVQKCMSSVWPCHRS